MSKLSHEFTVAESNPSFLLVRNVQFTFLEKRVISILESMGACSDEKIADILCMAPEEIGYIVDRYLSRRKKKQKYCVERDSFERRLRPNFTKMEYVIFKRKANGEYKSSGKPEYYEDSVLDEYDCRECDIPIGLENERAHKAYIIRNEHNDAGDAEAHRSD